jgi:hypothetical protein
MKKLPGTYHQCLLTTKDGQKTFEGNAETPEAARQEALKLAKKRLNQKATLKDFDEVTTCYGIQNKSAK